MGTQKNRLNETVLLSSQNTCSNRWVRKYLQFYAKNVSLSRPMILTSRSCRIYMICLWHWLLLLLLLLPLLLLVYRLLCRRDSVSSNSKTRSYCVHIVEITSSNYRIWLSLHSNGNRYRSAGLICMMYIFLWKPNLAWKILPFQVSRVACSLLCGNIH